MSRYKTPEGKELWVSCGISSGATWFTATTRKSGRGQQRYKSPALALAGIIGWQIKYDLGKERECGN